MRLSAFLSEEISQIHRLRISLLVAHCFEDLLARYTAHISRGFHIGESHILSAEIVDGILRNHPSVEPYIASLLRNFVSQIYAHFPGFFYRPDRITAPGHVQISLAFGHRLLAEICFPSLDVRFQRF